MKELTLKETTELATRILKQEMHFCIESLKIIRETKCSGTLPSDIAKHRIGTNSDYAKWDCITIKVYIKEGHVVDFLSWHEAMKSVEKYTGWRFGYFQASGKNELRLDFNNYDYME